MRNRKRAYAAFSESDIRSLEVPMKIGLLATVNDEGLPHLTLITTLQPSEPTQVVWGQFTEGLCKRFIRANRKTGFLVMTADRRLWRGKTAFARVASQGKEFEMYNAMPMFRYNAYFGVHTVYYMDLVEQYGQEVLPTKRIVWAAIKTMFAKALARKRPESVLNPWTRRLVNRASNLKFLSYVGADGYPVIIPVVQAQALDGARVIFSTSVYGDELAAIPAGATVAVFGLSLDMEDVLVRGELSLRRVGGVKCGMVDVRWVYNSMPPKPQQIHPEVALEAVRSF